MTANAGYASVNAGKKPGAGDIRDPDKLVAQLQNPDVQSISINGTAVTATGAELNILSGVLATAAEINRACDVSTRVVVHTATGAITEALHDNKINVLREAGGNALVTLTLPAATGAGGRYYFVVDEVNTSSYVIKAASGADVFRGTILSASTTDSATDAVNSWTAGATDDTLTLDGTTTGGLTRGDWVEFIDIAADGWAVRGVLTQSGTEATPFSDTVA
jgi:hypothetical protein